MKAVVFTLGCKVNEVESASVMSALEELGFEVSSALSFADIYILNTCAVTRVAERKSRQLISRVKKYNPQAKIYVCGCASQKDRESFESRGASFVGGARNKKAVAAAVARDAGMSLDGYKTVYPKQVKTRAFIKIEDGCNNFCSYCIIPYLRGREISRSIEDISEEIAKTEAPEIVLTGINISAYSTDNGGLTELIKSLKDTDKRVRLGSLECNVIDEEFLSALKELKDFAPQFHLSLQSGSDKVLKAMNRHYTRAQYLEKCASIYSYFPDAAITTDIIAGFCGETEEDFKDSLSIIGEAKFSRVHAFAYSPREGTRAFALPDVPADIKSDRLHRLIAAGKEAEERYISARIGRTYEIVAEDFDGEYTSGYTGSYIKTYTSGEHKGKIQVKLTAFFRDGVLCEKV